MNLQELSAGLFHLSKHGQLASSWEQVNYRYLLGTLEFEPLCSIGYLVTVVPDYCGALTAGSAVDEGLVDS
jgi:hypothetical protein